MSPKTVKECPICGKPTDPATKFYPFCSDRCKLIDLGNWSSESYVIHRPIRPEDDEKQGGESQEEDI